MRCPDYTTMAVPQEQLAMQPDKQLSCSAGAVPNKAIACTCGGMRSPVLPCLPDNHQTPVQVACCSAKQEGHQGTAQAARSRPWAATSTSPASAAAGCLGTIAMPLVAVYGRCWHESVQEPPLSHCSCNPTTQLAALACPRTLWCTGRCCTTCAVSDPLLSHSAQLLST